MNNLIKVIKEAQNILYCPKCRRKYGFDEIKLRGFLENVYVLQTVCHNNHEPLVLNIIVNVQNNNSISIKEILNNQKNKKDSTCDNKIIDIAVENFDGDFEKLWKQSN